ncbi:unnamed protein product [Ambrosiozyma monospora]|uniref:Unnamed protein product n=1 Tax=Ambrosiozyma monospora TaxID=43982 RepID=A0ACB5T6S9_AMBMO|nr:unnamed protein product [Ambrosiozyma monospora]
MLHYLFYLYLLTTTFLTTLIETIKIDHAGHQNDPHAQVREVLAYDKAFKAVIDFADSTEVETIIVSTSDHETGGASVALQVGESYPEYLWKPDVLLNATKSGEYVTRKLASYKASSKKDLYQFIKTEILEKDLGIHDYTEQDVLNIVAPGANPHNILNKLVSDRALIGWSTHGHSAVDVNIYGYSNTENGKSLLYKYLGGNRENTEIGRFWEAITGSDYNKITGLLEGTVHHTVSAQSLDGDAATELLGGFNEHDTLDPEYATFKAQVAEFGEHVEQLS